MPGSVASLLGAAVRAVARRALPRGTAAAPRTADRPGSGDVAPSTRRYPGDFEGRVVPRYAPDPDGDPDPGEIVWTWVPYEEDHARGKDRPVLLVGRDEPWLLGLMLSSRDHDPQDHGRWLDLGAGPWDSRGRPSEVRLDRVLRIDPAEVRREGAVLDRARFDAVARSLPGARG